VNARAYTPPLGKDSTADYDRAIRLWTRETLWRRAMLEELAARPGETILDVGCGTGSFAVRVIGIDPDEEALTIARAKADVAVLNVEWEQGFARDLGVRGADAIASSLMFHQVPMTEKRAGLSAMFAAVRPGGRIVIADYGRQKGLMRVLFRLTIQRLDGVADTQPNADGILPELVKAAGFRKVRDVARFDTVTGTIGLIVASRPD
jgi:ubiquinone/menaquinone biosynthesis C-methylase UbiE